MLGVKPLSTLPLGAIPAGLSQAVANPFALLIANPDAEFVFLMIARPYDPALARTTTGAPLSSLPLGAPPRLSVVGGERIVYLSDRGYKTTPSEDPANQDFPGRLVSPYNFEVDAFADGEPTGAGAAPSAGFGAIVAKNGDAALDDLLACAWDGRPIEVRAGGKDFAFADFATVWRGVSTGITWDRQTISWAVADLAQLFARPLARRLYAGTGGLEGGADIAGKEVPLAYGRVTAAGPVLVDAANQVWQWHDGPVLSVARVTDEAIVLDYDGDVADIYASAPLAGHAASCNAQGLIRLGSPPAGKIALDGRGDASGSGYVETAAAILRRLATTRLGALSLADPTFIDGGAFNRLDEDFAYPIGLYVVDTANADSVMDTIMATVDGWWTFTRDARLTVGRLAPPANPVRTISERDILGGDIKLVSMTPPAWRRRIGYDPVWNVHGAADIAGGATDADRTLLANAFRYNEPTRTDAQLTIHRLARDVVRNGLLALAADAETAQEFQQETHGVERRVYEVQVARALFRFWLGDCLTLQRARYGLDAGADYIVKGIVENGRGQKTTLRLWGPGAGTPGGLTIPVSPVAPVTGDRELREDGGIELREDGGAELRE